MGGVEGVERPRGVGINCLVNPNWEVSATGIVISVREGGVGALHHQKFPSLGPEYQMVETRMVEYSFGKKLEAHCL